MSADWPVNRPLSVLNKAYAWNIGGGDGTRTRGLLRDSRSNQLNYAPALRLQVRIPLQAGLALVSWLIDRNILVCVH